MVKAIYIALVLAFLPAALQATEVVFVIDNLKNNQGAVIAGIYTGKDTFLKKGKHLAGCATDGALNGKRAQITCELASGTYAAAIFHDENGNKKLDTNFIRIPKEGYGFSNNAIGAFGPPKFEDAAFTVGEKPVELKINLNY